MIQGGGCEFCIKFWVLKIYLLCQYLRYVFVSFMSFGFMGFFFFGLNTLFFLMVSHNLHPRPEFSSNLPICVILVLVFDDFTFRTRQLVKFI